MTSFEEKFIKQFPELKISSIEYDATDMVCNIEFIFSERLDLDESYKDSVKDYIIGELALKCSYNAVYKKSCYDCDIILKNILSYCDSNCSMMQLSEQLVDINYNQLSQSITVVIKVSRVNYEFSTTIDLCESLKILLEEKFFQKFEIDLYCDDEICTEDVIEKLKNEEEIVLLDRKINYYQVSDIVPIYGKNLIENVTSMYALSPEMTNVCIAGKIYFYAKTEYSKTYNKNGKDIVMEKVRYNFELRDFSSKISCVIFTTKAMLDSCDNLNNGMDVVVLCDVDSYNDRLSVRVKEFGTCIIPKIDIDEHITYMPERDDYMTIVPENYVEPDQINLFQQKIESIIPSYLVDKSFVVFDLETTGLDYKTREIIEIGAVKIENGEIISTFQTLIRPKAMITADITKINGITNEMVNEAPNFENVVADFYKYTRGCTLVAHNAEFDIGFLQHYGKQCRYNFDNEVIDTLKLARQQLKSMRSHKLKNVCEHFGVKLDNAHRAYYDTLATAKCFIKLAENI